MSRQVLHDEGGIRLLTVIYHKLLVNLHATERTGTTLDWSRIDHNRMTNDTVFCGRLPCSEEGLGCMISIAERHARDDQRPLASARRSLAALIRA